MRDFISAYRGTFINLCTENCAVENSIRLYFSSKNFSIVPFLKETNSFVLIVSDYPVDKGGLFKLLDPYRKFCDTVLLIVLNNPSNSQQLYSSDFFGFGITNIIMVSSVAEMMEELDKEFCHWIAINNLVNDEIEKKE